MEVGTGSRERTAAKVLVTNGAQASEIIGLIHLFIQLVEDFPICVLQDLMKCNAKIT